MSVIRQVRFNVSCCCYFVVLFEAWCWPQFWKCPISLWKHCIAFFDTEVSFSPSRLLSKSHHFKQPTIFSFTQSALWKSFLQLATKKTSVLISCSFFNWCWTFILKAFGPLLSRKIRAQQRVNFLRYTEVLVSHQSFQFSVHEVYEDHLSVDTCQDAQFDVITSSDIIVIAWLQD